MSKSSSGFLSIKAPINAKACYVYPKFQAVVLEVFEKPQEIMNPTKGKTSDSGLGRSAVESPSLFTTGISQARWKKTIPDFSNCTTPEDYLRTLLKDNKGIVFGDLHPDL